MFQRSWAKHARSTSAFGLLSVGLNDPPAMVKAGEASGQLDIILDRLADFLEANESLKREIKSAMTYPVISLVLIFGITAYLLVGVVPKFEKM